MPRGAGHPTGRPIADDRNPIPPFEGVVVGGEDDLGGAICIDIGDERVFVERAGGVPFHGKFHRAGGAVEHPERDLVGVDHFRSSIPLEVKNRAPGHRAGPVLDRHAPSRGATPLEHAVGVGTGHADLGGPIPIEV